MSLYTDHHDVNHAIIVSSAEELFAIGLKYYLGQDVARDCISAHKWFNLAAVKGSDAAKKYRCQLSQEMTPAEVVQAQREAQALLTSH